MPVGDHPVGHINDLTAAADESAEGDVKAQLRYSGGSTMFFAARGRSALSFTGHRFDDYHHTHREGGSGDESAMHTTVGDLTETHPRASEGGIMVDSLVVKQ